ncbi:LivK ABC-type branched-chain amino acid transport systems, periplasmic component [Candidatus Nanopelagicaceae bacterium]
MNNRASLSRSPRKFLAATAAVLAGALVLTAMPAQAAKTPGVSDTEIVLGMQLPQTGAASPGYNKVDDAIRAYFDYVNSKGGVNGRKITLVVKDDTYKAGLTVSTASALINKDKVFAMVGSVGTQTHISVIKDINRRGIPDLFVNSGYSGFYTDPKKYPTTFGGLGTYVAEAKILGKYIKETYADKTVGILYQTDDFGRNTVEGLATAGVTFTAKKTAATFIAGTQGGGLDAQMQQLKDNKVDVVVVGAVASAYAAAVGSALKIGYKPQFVVISVGSDATTFQTILGAKGTPAATSAALLAGTISASHAPAPGEADDEYVKAFKKINDEFNKGPSKTWDNNVLQGMNIGYLTTAALQGAGKNLTRPGIIKYIENNASKLSSAALAPLGYSAKTHEAFTGFWIGKYDATTLLKPIDGTRKMWTTDSGKGAVTELKYTRPAIAADALPKVG